MTHCAEWNNRRGAGSTDGDECAGYKVDMDEGRYPTAPSLLLPSLSELASQVSLVPSSQ